MQKIQGYALFGKQITYVIIANITMVILGIIQLPILTKALGSSQYGAWTIIITAVSLITPFASLGFSTSLIRFQAAEKDTHKIREDFLSACLLVLITGVIFALLLFLLSGFLATTILKDVALSSYLRLGSVLIVLSSIFPLLLAFFRRASKIGTFSLLNTGLNTIQVALIILFISLGYGLKGVIAAAILSAATLDIIGLFIIFKEIGFSFPKFSNMKTYLKWGVPLTPTSGIQWIIGASDRYIVNYFLGVSATGIYNAADTLGGYSSFATMPVGTALFPIISKTYDEGKLDECRDYFKYSFKYLMIFSIPIAVGLSMLAKPLLRILTTPEFTIGSSLVVLASLGGLSYCLYNISMYVIYLVSKTKIQLQLLSLAAVLNIALNVTLIPHMGILGAEVASVVAYTVLGVLGLIVSRRYFKFDLSLSFLARSILSSSFMALCMWSIKPQSIFMLFISIVVGIIAYFGFLILIGGFSRIELAFFTTFIKNSLKWSSHSKN